MDRLDRAFAKTLRNPRAAAAARRYGVARFRQRVRQHVAAVPLTFVQIEQEPEFIRASMIDVVSAWDFDGRRPVRTHPLTIREEIALFGHPGRMPSRRTTGSVAP